MVDFVHESSYTWPELLSLMALLRSEQGCPWDREQTHKSIRQNLLEEAYEVCEAIDNDDQALLCEELGDLLLQVVFHARMSQEAGSFTIADVIDGLCRKLVTRHPHVFGDTRVGDSAEVLRRWEEIKGYTKGFNTVRDAMSAIAKSLPALMRAEKIQKKAQKVGFDWPDVDGAWDKIAEETAELRQALRSGGDVEGELGDLLFSVVNVSRLIKIDPERALEKTCEKFIRRFGGMERAARSRGHTLNELSLSEMEELWEHEKGSDGPLPVDAPLA